MPRSSRHRSHREHNYGERSDSEDDRNSRDRKERAEGQGSGFRVSRDLESEKQKSSFLPRPGGGDGSVEHGRKRKDMEEDSAAIDRLNGAGGDDHMGPKAENVGFAESKKAKKSKLSAVASRERSSRRPEGSAERYEDSSSKAESTKRRSEKDLSRRSEKDLSRESTRRESSSKYRDAKEKRRERESEKDLSRRESSSQYKDAKEKERDRGLERDKKVHGSRHERPDDVGSRNQAAKTACSEEERGLKKDKELTEWQIRDDLHNVELEEFEKSMSEGDGSADRDKWQSDDRDGDDRQLSSRDDFIKNESYRNERHRDERHKDERYRDKYQEELDRDQRHRIDRHKKEHSSRDRTSTRSDSKHHRDENGISEDRYKKSKLQDSDHGGSYVEEHNTKHNDSRGRKRSFDENDTYGELRPQSAKESLGDVDRARPDKIDSNRSNSQPKSSPISVVHAIKDQSRHSLRQAEPAFQDLQSGERDHSSAAIVGHLAGVSGGRDRTSVSRSLEKTKIKDHISLGEYLIETAASSKFGKTQRSRGRSPSVRLIEKSQSTNDRQFLYRGGTRHCHDIEDVAKKSGSYKDQRDCPTDDVRARKLLLKSPGMDDYSKTENSEHAPLGPSFNRNGYFPGSLPGHLPPAPPVRHAIDSPILGSYEDDNISQIGKCKSSSRYRKHSDLNTGREPGSDWKSVPTWPSPVANGFLPFQHGQMPPGFPSAMQQFPAPLFGMRPYMDVTHAHVRPFGWHNVMGSPYPPQLQGWDGRSAVLSDDSHAYGRPEWDHRNRHLMDSRAWETTAGPWKVQNGNLNIEISQLQEPDYSTHSLPDEGWAGQSGNKSSSEQACSESTEIKQSNDAPASKNAAKAPSKIIDEKTPVPSKIAGDDCSRFCCNYLSKLDISVDLASPELYKQCFTLLGTGDSGVCNVSKHGCRQNINIVNKVVGKSPNNLLASLFPTNTEAFFQRAMSLYEKQHKVAKAMFPVATAKGEKDSPEVSDADKVKVIDEQPPEKISLADANSCRSKEEGSNVIAEAEDNVRGDAKEGKNTNGNALDDLSGDANEPHSDVISDSVVFGEGSQACEAVKSECRVNLNRIPISPESTH